MAVPDYFRRVSTASPEEIGKFLRTHAPEAYNLIDVRTPREYEKAHLPGARLIPLAELPHRLAELDRTKRTFTY